MPNFSFDIVSELNMSEINNVFDQAKREIDNRYDFKNTPARLDWLEDKKGFKIFGSADFQIESIIEILRKKIATRGLDQKILDVSKENTTSNLEMSKEIPFVSGLDQEKAKEISKLIRENNSKVKSQIQGDAVRVNSSSKDDLQTVMTLIRSSNLDYPLQFTNYR